MLKFYSASTSIVNSRRAITECIEVALEGEPNLDCDLIIIYAAIGHNFKELISEAKKLSPGARIAGCTGAGVIGREGPNESLKALAIMVIKGPENEFAVVGEESILSKDTGKVIAQLAKDLRIKNPDINMIHILPPSGNLNPVEELIEAIESVFGPEVPIFGGNAIDNMKGINCYHFLDDQVFEMGAIMLGFADPTLQIFSQASHGMKVLEGIPFEVTKSESNRIIELNGQPAWKLATKTLGVPETVHYSEIFMLAMLAVELPEKYHNDFDSRHYVGGIFGSCETGFIIYPTTIDEGTVLYLAKRDEDLMFQGVDQIAQRIAKYLEHKTTVAVFHADCLSRGKFSINRVLKDEIVGLMQHPICGDQKIPWLGFYSGGEYAMIGGKNWTKAFTTTLSVLYRNNS